MPDQNQIDLKAMQTLIRLIAAGARKENVSGLEVGWDGVLPLAVEQQVIPLVACALLYSPGLACPEELREHLLNAMRAESSQNLIKRQRIMHLLKKMKDAGIDVKLLKGYAVSGCYTHPECRGSVDTDILIDVQQESQAVKFMEEHEFRVDPRAVTSHHVVCQHKKYGMVELHVALYAELIQDNWFQNINESELVQEPAIMDEDFCSLGHTDQLIFLTLHMVKHFILEGLTLKMMLDLALYFSTHMDAINVTRYWHIMDKLRYTGLVRCVLNSMALYGGFKNLSDQNFASVNSKQVSMVLEDLVRGGYLGSKEKEDRYASGMEYNRVVLLEKKTKKQYVFYMALKKIRTSINLMFLRRKQLQDRYPDATKCALFIPVVWIYHVIAYPIRKIVKGNVQKDIYLGPNGSPFVRERVELFKCLGMLNDTWKR